MLSQSFAPFMYLFIGAVIGGLSLAVFLRWRDRTRRPSARDPLLPLQVRLIDRVEPALLAERRWYSDVLTPREMEIALRAAAGERNGDIARALVISPLTVETHIKNIYKKLDVSSRIELAHALAGLQDRDTDPP